MILACIWGFFFPFLLHVSMHLRSWGKHVIMTIWLFCRFLFFGVCGNVMTTLLYISQTGICTSLSPLSTKGFARGVAHQQKSKKAVTCVKRSTCLASVDSVFSMEKTEYTWSLGPSTLQIQTRLLDTCSVFDFDFKKY